MRRGGTRPGGAPHYEIMQVIEGGGDADPEFYPLLDPPWEALTDRRGFLRAGLSAGAVLALLGACGPAATPGTKSRIESSVVPEPTQVPGTEGAASQLASAAPTARPTTRPTKAPTPRPTKAPTPRPTKAPTPRPTKAPTPRPTKAPTPRPTKAPTPRPTASATPSPAANPTESPAASPTPRPSSNRTCTCHGVGICTCNTVCTCNKICTCIPVCQAHRLLDPDPTVRTMAEEIVLVMGATEMEYLRWAADAAQPDLRARIVSMIARIHAGAAPDPTRWPSIAACAAHLDDGDPVVRFMSAQMLELHARWQGADLGAMLGSRVLDRMAEGQSLRWRPPAERRTAVPS